MTGRTFEVVVVEDDDLVRAWLAATLSGTEFRLAGDVGGVEAALEMLGRRHADLLLIDYRLDTGTGIDLLRRLRAAGNSTPAILMTAHAQEGLNEAAREAGAQASILKKARRDVMLSEMRAVVIGATGSFDAAHPSRPSGQRSLSPREREILGFVASGLTNRQIAEKASISVETVKTHVERIYAKLGVERRVEAVAEATRQGILPG